MQRCDFSPISCLKIVLFQIGDGFISDIFYSTLHSDVVDDAAGRDTVEANVNFILDLLKLLISGESLENFLSSKE